VAPGGALAVQIPGNIDALPHRLMRELAASPAWSRWFPAGKLREWHHHEMDFYYDVLAAAARLELWATEYLHILPDTRSIVEWYRGTGMRPFLEALESDADRERFAADYLDCLQAHYPPRAAGGVLFPFRRIFLIAYAHEE
jgi:trans-aconitate 2-methyltransferase